MKYVTKDEIEDFLIRTKAFQAKDDIPELDYLVERAEFEFENWLGFCPAIQTYSEQHKITQTQKDIVLRQFPVQDVIKVQAITGMSREWHDITAYWWWQESHLQIRDDFSSLLLPSSKINVVYKAGFDPIPQQFIMVFLELVRTMVTQGEYPGDTRFLYEPIKNVQSISVSGISKSFQNKETNKNHGSVLDKTLAPLEKYRRKFFW